MKNKQFGNFGSQGAIKLKLDSIVMMYCKIGLAMAG